MADDLDLVKFVGRLGFAVGDGADADEDPDIIWCDGGTVRLTPLITDAKVTGSTTPWLAAFGPIDLTLDANGYATWNGAEYIWLDDLGDGKTNPTIATGNATHRVDFIGITAGGTSVKFATRNVRISADTATDPAHPTVPMLPADGGVCNLAVLSPVPAAGVSPITQGDPGLGIVSIAVDTSNLVTTMTDGSTLTAPVEAAFSTGLPQAVSDAQDSATAAATSESNAADSASAAASSASDAADSATAAQAAASTATDAFTAHMRGAWDAATAYAVDDLSTDQGSTWRRLVAGTTAAHPSTDATNWAVFAQKGVDGTGSVSSVAGVSPDGNGNVTLTASDVGARADTWTPTAAEVGARADTWVPTDADLPTRLSDASLSAAYADKTATTSALAAKVDSSLLGAANGVATTDSAGKVLVSQLPTGMMQLKGSWNASTNTPALADGTGTVGAYYRVSVAGTRNLGSGSVTFAVGDFVIYNDINQWELSHSGADAVQSVAGLTGAITVAGLQAAGVGGVDPANELLIGASINHNLINTATANVGAALDNLRQLDGLASSPDLRACATLAAVKASSTAVAAAKGSPTVVALVPTIQLAGAVAGDSVFGGYYVGTIDTTTGNIIAGDAYQTGKKYALIMSPASYDVTGYAWQTTASLLTGAETRWDGLSATAALKAAGLSPAANYCVGISYPTDGGSSWYLPAMDELELLYRTFKPTTENNYTTSESGNTFPTAAQIPGVNPSSSPTGAAYTTSSPAQTALAAFKSGGSNALNGVAGTQTVYWSSSAAASSGAWSHYVAGGTPGWQHALGQTFTSTARVRPVRRVLLS